jgi:cell division protein FtsA
MLPEKKLFMFYLKNLKLMVNLKLKAYRMYGGRLESSFHVVVGQASSIRNVGRCIQSSGIELSGLTLEPLVLCGIESRRKKLELP